MEKINWTGRVKKEELYSQAREECFVYEKKKEGELGWSYLV
jgi:hypothetical protein